MPELPEVETLRRGLEATVLGARIRSVDLPWRPVVAAPDALLRPLVGRRLAAVRRRGKGLVVDLDRDLHLLLHLKMTGQLVVVRDGATVLAGGHPSPGLLGPMPNPSTRAVLALSGGRVLFFNDQRKFGWIRVLDTAELSVDPFLARLGPEPLGDEFSLPSFRARLASHPRAPGKAVLLDQSTVAGLGNVYTDEALHRARIDPRRRCADLSDDDVRRLHASIRATLGDAVEHGGTSFAAYVNDARGRETYLARHGRVFGRAGQPCPVCGTPIARIRVAGRGTSLCPHCQRAPGVPES